MGHAIRIFYADVEKEIREKLASDYLNAVLRTAFMLYLMKGGNKMEENDCFYVIKSILADCSYYV